MESTVNPIRILVADYHALLAKVEPMASSLPLHGFGEGKGQLSVGIELYPYRVSGTELSGDNLPADGRFYELLDRPAQGSSSKVGIGPFVRDAAFYSLGDFQGYALSNGQPVNPIEEEVGYTYELVVSQGVEDDDLVHPV